MYVKPPTWKVFVDGRHDISIVAVSAAQAALAHAKRNNTWGDFDVYREGQRLADAVALRVMHVDRGLYSGLACERAAKI